MKQITQLILKGETPALMIMSYHDHLQHSAQYQNSSHF